MRFNKFLVALSFITFMALIYVYQQAQIFYLAYQSDKKQARLQDSLDKNSILKYNMNVFASLPYLDRSFLSKCSDFELPQEQRLVQLDLTVGPTVLYSKVSEKKPNLFSKFLNIITKQAEAKPINR